LTHKDSNKYKKNSKGGKKQIKTRWKRLKFL